MRLRIAPITAIALVVVGCLNLALMGEITIRALSNDKATSTRSTWEIGLSAIGIATGRKPVEAYAEILAHPVFFKSRQPFVPPPPAPPPPQMKSPPAAVIDPGLAVGGVMMKGTVSKAYLTGRPGTDGVWAYQGETIQGWTITSINQAGVRIEQAGRSIDLQLYPK
ncbi:MULTISPECIES: hypothetical protein [unclassified Bradyrhizobium]|uniref:hypothetical protein n=1 Tax=unclassified Bradyrhizobium TaxID=2631580 RepID=UPI0028EFB5F0|nr:MULTISPECIES: hypothetical protein [unclassified Bradyrhizobium]